MKRMECINEYKECIHEIKEKITDRFSNIFLLPKEIATYIEEGRMSYEKTDSAIWFIVDEVEYYKLFVMGDSPQGFVIPNMDKQVLFRILRKENSKPSKLEEFENWATQNNMKLKCSSYKMLGDIDEMYNNLSNMKAYKKMLLSLGFKIHKSCEKYLPEISELIKRVPFVENYHLDYVNNEEKAKLCANGGYICIESPDGEICGAIITKFGENVVSGIATVVDEKYAMRGIAPVLAYERISIAKKLGYKKITGNVRIDNKKSLAYNKKLGFKIVDMIADDWILQN